MLRPLNVDTGQPKTKSAIPTAEERKALSKGENEFFDRQIEQDKDFRVAKALANAQRAAIEEKLLSEEGGGGKKK